jgi:hypothetical protein
MGYTLGHGLCYGCNQPFSFNPVRVPSIEVEGTRRPICRACVDRINPMRTTINGLPPIVPAPDAYDACDESELE